MKSIKVVHFSDWHGQFQKLPEADLYICTGDMLPNFPIVKICTDPQKGTVVNWDRTSGQKRPEGEYFGRIISPDRERVLQEQWLLQQNFRQEFLGSPSSPVACVRGNHDFADIWSLFHGGDVWEVTHDSSRTWTFEGLKIGGMRGIPYIRGEWADEYRVADLQDVIDKMPHDLDVLITHMPADGINDGEYIGALMHNYGSVGLRQYIDRSIYHYSILAHCCGHVHDAANIYDMDGIVFSNAACTYHTFELKRP